jgi:hypothetical protein
VVEVREGEVMATTIRTDLTIQLQRTSRGWWWSVEGEDGRTVRDCDRPHANASMAACEAETWIASQPVLTRAERLGVDPALVALDLDEPSEEG